MKTPEKLNILEKHPSHSYFSKVPIPALYMQNDTNYSGISQLWSILLQGHIFHACTCNAVKNHILLLSMQ